MRQYSVDCGAENPISLRGTKLRKHTGTKCISLKLTDNQVSVLADHLGYHKDIHKKYYQQPISTLDIVKVSKLLEAAVGNGVVEEENKSGEGGKNPNRKCIWLKRGDSVFTEIFVRTLRERCTNLWMLPIN